MTYGADVWGITEQIRKRLRATEVGYCRSCWRLTLRGKVRNEAIRCRLTTVTDTVSTKMLIWYRNVSRVSKKRWANKFICGSTTKKVKRYTLDDVRSWCKKYNEKMNLRDED